MTPPEWAPPTAGIVGYGAVGSLMAGGSIILVTDPPGRILAGLAGLGLLVFATGSWRARPKLAITATGLAVRGWFTTQSLQRGEIKIVRITEFRRMGRKTRLLEIETTGGGLWVFSRWDLGTDPLQVLDTLTAAGIAGGGFR